VQCDLDELIRAPGDAGAPHRRTFDQAQRHADSQCSRELLAEGEEVIQVGVIDRLEVVEQRGGVVDPKLRLRNVEQAQLEIRGSDPIRPAAH